MILAATGLERERRILSRPGIEVVVGGGDRAQLEAELERLAARARGIISIGIAGGLAPGLRVGDWVVADAVRVGSEPMATDARWTGRLAARLPDATRGMVLGSNAIVAEAAEKAALHRATAALAVDMESHVAAQVAARHRLPFAVARVVCDAAHRTLPPAARVGMRHDGRMDMPAVLRSVSANPGQLPALILTGWDAERAFKGLLRGCRRLGPGLGADLGELALDMP